MTKTVWVHTAQHGTAQMQLSTMQAGLFRPSRVGTSDIKFTKYIEEYTRKILKVFQPKSMMWSSDNMLK